MSDGPAESSELEERPRTPLARQAGASVGVYAAITGFAGAIPIPILDSMMTELARGAAMRRVARRHGVTLTPGARTILAGQGSVHATSTARGRLLKSALATVLAPFRVAARIEDAFGTLFSSIVLDHFLRRPGRPPGAVLTEPEARRIRAASETAVAQAGFDVLRTVPLGLWSIIGGAFDDLVNADAEGRSPVERFVDSLLDGLADAPNDLVDTLTHHFDVALADVGGTP